ncbi:MULTISPECIES: glycosyltransferase family 2 protein [unclassified Marinobacterium]|uniref:glycosyltransferase family 2 protein n=1 Tax=unclassified Marinobacterium TaxID=2644139 RepID=UPI0015696435|nr:MULTISPECIES: glycosyltransferase family 2 protein [unclassified Marinobacterium]NRP56634.1 PGL/p-HBAD biosynthesis glycosyltransferase [Marinobacterium sp. xm-d-510]NRP96577.1 PGL/p-HBAD biosynthesis glycosyltransferase [Marinobacterium sp. xm-a-127]
MKISLITVCYNSESFITSAIDSVLSQDYDNIEYIIIDGASVDSTVSIVQSYGDKISYFVSESDNGIYDAMNKGLALANGDVIGILNSDDFYPHDYVIAEVVKVFATNPSVDMVLGNIDFVQPDDLTKPRRFYSSFNFVPWKMRFGFMPAHPAAFIKRSAYEKVGNYKLGYKIGADFEWLVRALFVQKLSYIKLNQTLVRMREGGVSTAGLKSYWISSQELLLALRKNEVYSNMLFVLIRLPIKLCHKFFRKG